MLLVENPSDLERITSNISIDEHGCWNWNGSLSKGGYAVLRARGKRANFYGHRAMFFLSGKGDPGKLMVCHTCDNRRCVNPDHLFLGTAKRNVHDMIEKKRNCRESARVEAALNSKRIALRKLSEEQAKEAYARARSGERLSKIAEDMGVTYHAIHAIKNGDTWSHVTGEKCKRHSWIVPPATQ